VPAGTDSKVTEIDVANMVPTVPAMDSPLATRSTVGVLLVVNPEPTRVTTVLVDGVPPA